MAKLVTIPSSSNQEIVSEISARIQKELLEGNYRQREGLPIRLRVSSLDIDYWSFIFQVTWCEGWQEKGVFAKIPRFNWHNDNISDAIHDPVARRMGETEFQSLVRLYDLSSAIGDDVKPVRPIAYWADYNVVLTERVEASELFTTIRSIYLFDCLKRRGGNQRIEDLLQRLGSWLKRFHTSYQHAAEPTRLDTQAYTNELESFWSGIIENCSAQGRAAGLAKRLSQIKLEDKQQFVPMIEGFEIRNVLWNASIDQLYLVDPGAIEDRPSMESIARFLVSLDILYWGSVWFLFKYKPSALLGEAFLRGYFGQSPMSASWLTFFRTRELLRQWFAACEVHKTRNLPKLLHRLIQELYIDRFYFAEIEKNVLSLEEGL